MKPAVVLSEKDVKRLLSLVTTLRQLAEKIAGTGGSIELSQRMRGPRRKKEETPPAESA